MRKTIKALEAEIASRDQRIAELETHVGAKSEEWVRAFLDQRGVRGEPCQKCGGFGVRSYSSTATWRGGIGGCAMTDDVCNKCWGSGDDSRPWPSHREFERMNRSNPRP